MRHCTYHQVEDSQVKLLLSFIESDLSTGTLSKQATALNLLKAIVRRRVLLPEVYDLMTMLQETVLHTHHLSVQRRGGAILVMFLLDYPLTPQRLQQHLGFFLNNLNYAHAEGRMGMLELLHVLMYKLPLPVLVDKAQLMFLPLVLALMNDDAAKCRAKVAQVLQAQMTVLSKETATIDILLRLVLKWLSVPQTGALQRAGAQVFGLAVECLDASLQRHFPALFAGLSELVRHYAHSDTTASSSSGVAATTPIASNADQTGDDSMQVDGHETATAPSEEEKTTVDAGAAWQVLYYCLLCVEKLLKKHPKLTVTQIANVQVSFLCSCTFVVLVFLFHCSSAMGRHCLSQSL